MNRIFDIIRAALDAALSGTIRRIADFLPNLVSAMVILLLGWIVAKVGEKVTGKLLQTLRVDHIAERRGVTGMLRDIGVRRSPVAVVSRTLFWIVLILFLVPALEALQLTYVSQLVGRFVAYIPNLVAAALIFIIGLAIARLLSASVAASARSAGMEYAPAVGLFIKYFLSLVVIILSLAQLGVQTGILTNIFTVLIVSLGLALALALGLGSRAVVANILAGAFAREHFPEGREIEIQGMRGKVVVVGSVGTEIDCEGRQITVPNTMLMETVVE